jgi:hypothetical protein
MLRRLLVALTLVLGVPAVAFADPAACPEGLPEVTGEQPSYAEVSAMLETAAGNGTPKIPVGVLKAIAYQESRWKQYDAAPGATGPVVVSSAATDAVCGVGMMQVTSTLSSDAMRLATDVAFNIAEGARILRAKWTESIASGNPDGGGEDDPAVVENWYYAVCLYNGCGTDEAYPDRIAEISADPFRRVSSTLKPYMPIRGFTKPSEALPSYELLGAFQARLNPDVFVFYDHTNGDISQTVSAPTHHYLDPAPTVAYGTNAYGPDGSYVSCTGCSGWRLLEGVGIAGRAHYTLAVTSEEGEGARVTWKPPLPRTGPYRLSAYVPPAADPTILGRATYHIGSATVSIDQAARAGKWAALGDRTLSPGNTVWLNDVSTGTAGKRLVADAMLFAPITTLSLSSHHTSLTYGASTTLVARLLHAGTGVPGRAVRFYQRPVGGTVWTSIGYGQTTLAGSAGMTVKPTRNMEYTARYVATGWVSSASGNRRVYVAPRITAYLSDSSVPRNTAAKVSTYVVPGHAGQKVYLQRLVDNAWQTVTYKYLASNSTATFTFSRSTPGTYYYRIYKPADSDHIAAKSATMTLRVT